MTYSAPIDEQLLALGMPMAVEGWADEPGSKGYDWDLVRSLLSGSAALATEVFAPLNTVGDRTGVTMGGDGVLLPTEFAGAYRAYVDGGWAALAVDIDHGGHGLPFPVAVAVHEQMASANMALSLCSTLTLGAVEAIARHGSDELKAQYLEKLVTGEWTGTMNLTEPQAGSDVGALRTIAIQQDDRTYLLKGTKIFISWGDHDLAPNIVHLVLARVPYAPDGTKGISLFLVPKLLPDGTRNDVRCVSIEHKLGLHASPTCTMHFGDDGRCTGWLVGEENAGMRAMFTMMNHARIMIASQGVAIAERAYQHAAAYAVERIQSAMVGQGGPPVAICHHPDVRRMLLTLRSSTEAIRALVYYAAEAADLAHDRGDAITMDSLADLLTPIAKAFATDIGFEMTSVALQVFGGAGYVEETGAAQYLRDARIASIYEGTNGIQALDLVMRKVRRSERRALRALLDRMSAPAVKSDDTRLGKSRYRLEEAVGHLRQATAVVLSASPAHAAAVATPYLRLFGRTLSGWLLLEQAEQACKNLDTGALEAEFLNAKIESARFYAEQLLPETAGLLAAVTSDQSALTC